MVGSISTISPLQSHILRLSNQFAKLTEQEKRNLVLGLSEDDLLDVEFVRFVSHRPIYEALVRNGILLKLNTLKKH